MERSAASEEGPQNGHPHLSQGLCQRAKRRLAVPVQSGTELQRALEGPVVLRKGDLSKCGSVGVEVRLGPSFEGP